MRKVLRDVWARRGRTLLVSLAIFIGVTGTIALFTVSDSLTRQLREDIQVEELPMVTVFTAPAGDGPLDNPAYVEALEGQPGVTEVLAFTAVPLKFQYGLEDEGTEDIFAVGFLDPYNELAITPIRVLDGEYPSQPNQVALETRMAKEFGLGIGDTMYITILSSSRDPQQNGAVGTLEAFQVTGIIFDPYISTRNASADQAVYMSLEDAGYASAQRGVGGFAGRFVNFEVAEDQKDEFASVIADQTPYLAAFILIEDPEQSQLITSVQTLTGTLAFLALVSLAVSGFLVVNVISSIVVEQKRQIGVMKSIGASTLDTFFIYAGIALMYGILAVIPGTIVGVLGGNAIAHFLGDQLDIILTGFQFSPASVILGIGIGLMIPVIAAFLPVILGTRVSILEAITDLGIDAKYGSGPLARLIGVLPIPVTVRQGLSNVSIKKGRLIFTTITLSIAVGAAMGIYGFFFNIQSGINSFLDSFNVQVLIAPNQEVPEEEFQRILQENFPEDGPGTGILSIEPGFNIQVEFEGYTPLATAGGPPGIFAYGYDVTSENPAFNFTIDEGQALDASTRETGIILSSNLAEGMGKSVGDTVLLKVPGNQAELTVVGISNYPIDQAWMDWRTIALTIGYTSTANVESRLEIPADAQNFIPYAAPVQVNGASVDVIGFSQEAGGFLSSLVTEGAFYEVGQNGLVISQSLADSQGLAVGDSVSLDSTVEGGQTGLAYTVVGILDLPPQMTTEGLPSDFAAMFWQELAALDGLTLEEKPRPAAYFIISDIEDPSIRQMNNLLDDIADVLLAEGISVQEFNFISLIEQINAGFVTIQIILQMVALLIAFVGALGLFTTLSMAVFERQKEIGVMRSIGAGSGTVALQFLTEGLVVGVLSWIVGLPLAYGVMIALFSITGFGDTFAADFPPLAAIGGLIGMLVITTIASLWPAFAASRKTVSEILRYQ
jgi:ABC-type lipoprotein release transport system permease subunit